MELGCGTAPILPGGFDAETYEPVDTRPWDVGKWREEMAANNLPQTGFEAVEYGWQYANFGGVVDALNMPWPMCPRYYTAFAAPQAWYAAGIVIRAAQYRKLGALSAVLSGPVTPLLSRLMGIVDAINVKIDKLILDEAKD
jgi:hypothetical protein